MSSPTIPAALLDAVMFAAERHKNQRRKDKEASPYINHPLALAHLLATKGGVEDVATLQAAILHDTIEDTETTEEELRLRFGGVVADIVVELTDDKSLPKQRRKELQVEHAPHKSNAAALVKLADKTCNLRDIANTPPADWTVQRRQEYFDWAKRVVDGLPKVSEPLLTAFLSAYAHRPMDTMPVGPTDREGSWLSMPGAMRGTSGFVRVLDSGAIEVGSMTTARVPIRVLVVMFRPSTPSPRPTCHRWLSSWPWGLVGSPRALRNCLTVSQHSLTFRA